MVANIASAVLAQTTAPTPAQAESPSLILYYGVIAVLLLATVMISIIPSKRTHQD